VFVAANLALLCGVVASNHDPEVFMGLFLIFLGLAEAYYRHHDRLMLREGLMVAFFLAPALSSWAGSSGGGSSRCSRAWMTRRYSSARQR
jgi:hypothetical protein